MQSHMPVSKGEASLRVLFAASAKVEYEKPDTAPTEQQHREFQDKLYFLDNYGIVLPSYEFVKAQYFR